MTRTRPQSPGPQFPSPVETPVFERRESDGTRVLVLLPDLDTLLGVVGFSRSDAIVLNGLHRRRSTAGRCSDGRAGNHLRSH